MGVLVIGAQRVQLLRMEVAGTRQGVLFPDLVGHLSKQGAPGAFSLAKWKRRRRDTGNKAGEGRREMMMAIWKWLR